MKATHTHKDRGGQFARIGTAAGEGELAGHSLVIYLDLTPQPPATHYITLPEWEAGWREIPADACPVCHGSGHDQIKKRKDRPCGGCFGLGKVKQDGETPQEMWELADVAGRIIKGLREDRCQLRAKLQVLHETPGVAEAIEAERQRRQQERDDAQAEQERKWRDGRGHGAVGARYTGD